MDDTRSMGRPGTNLFNTFNCTNDGNTTNVRATPLSVKFYKSVHLFMFIIVVTSFTSYPTLLFPVIRRLPSKGECIEESSVRQIRFRPFCFYSSTHLLSNSSFAYTFLGRIKEYHSLLSTLNCHIGMVPSS